MLFFNPYFEEVADTAAIYNRAPERLAFFYGIAPVWDSDSIHIMRASKKPNLDGLLTGKGTKAALAGASDGLKSDDASSNQAAIPIFWIWAKII